jgi:CheY-like chemotaxis protein
MGAALVVDDLPEHRHLARKLLARLGFEVDEAPDGEQALASLLRRRFDLVLMDLEMPVLDGFAAAAELRRREAGGTRTPIVAVSSSTVEGDAERALAAGMDLFVAKPITLERLASAVAAVLPGPLDLRQLGQLRSYDPGGAVLREFAELLMNDAPRRLRAMRERDAAAVWRAAHALKGAAGLAGAHRLVPLLDDIERLGRAGELPDEDRVAAVEAAYAEVEAALRRATS